MVNFRLATLVTVRYERRISPSRGLLSAPGRLERRRKLLELRRWSLEEPLLRAKLERLYGRSRWARHLIDSIMNERREVQAFDSEDHSRG